MSGIARGPLVWRLRGVSAAVRQLLRRAVVQTSRSSERMEDGMLFEHADALDAVVALPSDTRVVTLVSEVDPPSASLLGAHLPRWLPRERDRDKAHDCHMVRCRDQLASVGGRVGIPAADEAAVGAALMRELAPFVRELGADDNDASGATRRGADRAHPVTAGPRGAAASVGGNRRGDCNPLLPGSATASAAGVPENSAPEHITTAETSSSIASAAAPKTLGRDGGAVDMGAGVGKAPLMTPTADPTPSSGRATPSGSEMSRRHDVRGSRSVRAAARHRYRREGRAIEEDPPAAGRVSLAPGDIFPETPAVTAAFVADMISRPLTAPSTRPQPPWPPNPNEVLPISAYAPGAVRGGAPAP